VFPISDFSEYGDARIRHLRVREPKYDVEECQQRGMTFAAPLKVTLRLIVFDVDEDTGARPSSDIKEQDVYMGDMPLMTDNGTFVVNGTERVIVSQMHRSPGRVLRSRPGKTHAPASFLFAARVIPYRGSWLDFEFDAKDIVYVRIDRRRKLPATTLLMALGWTTRNPRPHTFYARGSVYDHVVFAEKDGWKTPFDPERMRGVKLTNDLIDAKTGEGRWSRPAPRSPRGWPSKLVEKGLKEIARHRRGTLSAATSPRTSSTWRPARSTPRPATRSPRSCWRCSRRPASNEIRTARHRPHQRRPYIRNTLAVDKNTSREEALFDIYRVMRPGEPPTLETAEAMFRRCSSIPSATTCRPSAASR
jgi:DNA-directed RNA polymerase subunit beta